MINNQQKKIKLKLCKDYKINKNKIRTKRNKKIKNLTHKNKIKTKRK